MSGDFPHQLPGLEIDQADDGFIVYQAERDRVHYLSPSAVLVLELCTGSNTTETIVELLARVYGSEQVPDAAVRETLAQLWEAGLITRDPESVPEGRQDAS
jgi:hypothetical protein